MFGVTMVVFERQIIFFFEVERRRWWWRQGFQEALERILGLKGMSVIFLINIFNKLFFNNC